MNVNRDGTWLVNKLKSILKAGDEHGPSPAVCISCARDGFCQSPGFWTMVKEFCYFPPISGQALEKLSAEVDPVRSEEHTSELQSHVNLVCRLLLEKKKKKKK